MLYSTFKYDFLSILSRTIYLSFTAVQRPERTERVAQSVVLILLCSSLELIDQYRKWINALLASAMRCVSSRFFIVFPCLL